MRDKIKKISVLTAILAFGQGAYGSPSTPQHDSPAQEEGCSVTERCTQEGSILDLTQDTTSTENQEDKGDFRPGEWNPSFKGRSEGTKTSFPKDLRDQVAEGGLRSGGIDPAVPGGAGNTSSSLGTVDSYRY